MNPFEKRVLGRTGIEVSLLGFGAGQLGEPLARMPEDQAQEAINAGLEAGIAYWDTAPWYGLGLSEHRVGHGLRRRPRDRFVLSTKVGRVLFRPEDPGSVDRGPWAGGLPFSYRFDYTYGGIMRSYEDSLMRLGLNRVDLLLIHDLDPGEHGSEEAVERHLAELDRGGGFRALAELRSSGDVGGIGAGINQAEMMPRFVRDFDIDLFLLALPYSLLDQGPLDAELPLCAERDIGIVKGAPYASGILATWPGPDDLFGYRPAPPPVLDKVRAIRAVCDRHGVALRAASLQFLLGHPSIATVIPGCSSRAEVLDNIEMVRAPIPGALWDELKAEGLVREDAPTP